MFFLFFLRFMIFYFESDLKLACELIFIMMLNDLKWYVMNDNILNWSGNKKKFSYI